MTTYDAANLFMDVIQWLVIAFIMFKLGELTERREYMSEVWKPQPSEVYRDWVDTILKEASDELSAWETQFIADIETRLDNRWNLTKNQANKLEQIYASKTK